MYVYTWIANLCFVSLAPVTCHEYNRLPYFSTHSLTPFSLSLSTSPLTNLSFSFNLSHPLPALSTSQVNKKRHIGNDMVCVVFLDGPGATFNPTWIRSHFIHCYIVVQHIPGARGQPLYKVLTLDLQHTVGCRCACWVACHCYVCWFTRNVCMYI